MEVNMRNIIKAAVLAGVMVMCLWIVGCSSEKTDVKKIKDLDFTVVENADVPEELMKLIEEKKAEPFKLTYSNKEYLYIVKGYGEQKTGGYSILVNSLYLTSNAVYFNTSLKGPSKDEMVTQALSYPYIVVKIEEMDKTVVFE